MADGADLQALIPAIIALVAAITNSIVTIIQALRQRQTNAAIRSTAADTISDVHTIANGPPYSLRTQKPDP